MSYTTTTSTSASTSQFHVLPTSTGPLKLSGTLDRLYPDSRIDLTPAIGTEFKEGVQLSEMLALEGKEGDDLIRDIGILIARRGVVFFKSQGITLQEQRTLAQRLGKLTGKPAQSGLHVNPLTKETSELGDEVSVITTDKSSPIAKAEYYADQDPSKFASNGWHSDVSFEKVPADYSLLKMHTLPPIGGDTLWASSYALYTKLSPVFANFLSSLSAVHEAKYFRRVAEVLGVEIRKGTRGNPENFGDELEAVHPVVRTNPVTGWKGVFVNKGFTRRILGLTRDESDDMINYLFKMVAENHDIQVRYRWGKNDLAIWDNRSSFHTATFDYSESRAGDRVVSVGEKPFYDPNSVSWLEGLERERNESS